MSLDDKIVQAVIPGFSSNMPVPNFVNKIKDAFAAEGYVQPVKLTRQGAYEATNDSVYLTPTLMTGQEWYDRFLKLLAKYPRTDQLNSPQLWSEDVILKEARRAAGLTDA